MTDNNKKSNFLITVLFPNDTSFCSDVESELTIQQELAKVMFNLVKQGVISHFAIGDDDIISNKLK